MLHLMRNDPKKLEGYSNENMQREQEKIRGLGAFPSEKLFEVTISRMLENTLLQHRICIVSSLIFMQRRKN